MRPDLINCHNFSFILSIWQQKFCYGRLGILLVSKNMLKKIFKLDFTMPTTTSTPLQSNIPNHHPNTSIEDNTKTNPDQRWSCILYTENKWILFCCVVSICVPVIFFLSPPNTWNNGTTPEIKLKAIARKQICCNIFTIHTLWKAFDAVLWEHS